jgi:hypothetical protein
MTTERKLIEKLEWLSNGYGTITDKYGVIHYVIIKHDLDAFISELESELSALEKEAEQKSETQWIKFEDKMPLEGQEILLVWPSGNYHPEYRKVNKSMLEGDCSLLRWMPIPKY